MAGYVRAGEEHVSLSEVRANTAKHGPKKTPEPGMRAPVTCLHLPLTSSCQETSNHLSQINARGGLLNVVDEMVCLSKRWVNNNRQKNRNTFTVILKTCNCGR